MNITDGYRTYWQAFPYHFLELATDDSYYRAWGGQAYNGIMWLDTVEHARDRQIDWTIRVFNWLAPQPSISGYVTAEGTGKGIQRAIVNCYEWYQGKLNGTIPVAGAMVDPDGYYELTSLSPDRTYACQAHHVDYEEEWYQEKTPDDFPADLISFVGHERIDNINFTLDSGTIYGWVFDVDGPAYNPDHGSVAVLLFNNYSGERASEPLN